MSTPILPFASWASGTNQNSLPANDNSRRNQILNGEVISKAVTAQPAGVEGAIYILAATHTGAQWAAFDPDDLVIYSGGTWYAFAPVEGVVVNFDGSQEQYSGSGGWSVLSGGGGGGVTSVNGASGVVVLDTDDIPEGANLYLTNERVDDRVAALLVAGTNITLTYNDGAGTLTVDAAGGGGLTNWTDSVDTSSPNATTPAVRLLATNAATNVDAVISPKGDGAILAQVPDGTNTGGDKRGTSAVDLQRNRSVSSDKVASGSRSFIGGGNDNKASGSFAAVVCGELLTASGSYSGALSGYLNTASSNYSFIGGGRNNTVNAQDACILGGNNNQVTGQWGACYGGRDNSIVGLASIGAGWGSKTQNDYCEVYSAGNFATVGDAQRIGMVLRSLTTNATQTALTGDQSAVAAGNQLTLENSSAIIVKGLVVARQNSTGDTATWEFTAAIKRGANAAATAMVAACTPTVIAADAGASTWALSVTADTTQGALAVKFTGQAAKTIRTVCTITSASVVG